mgnify:CR=1 FL=1
MILRPEYTIDSLEKDIDVLKQTYDMGYRVTKENINRIKELFRRLFMPVPLDGRSSIRYTL